MINAIGNVGPGAHVQLSGDPFQGHGCLGPQAFGNPDFAPVAFESGLQIPNGPLQARQFLFDDPPGFVFFGFPDVIPGDVFGAALFHRVEEFLAKYCWRG